jgi:hypothetical protein
VRVLELRRTALPALAFVAPLALAACARVRRGTQSDGACDPNVDCGPQREVIVTLAVTPGARVEDAYVFVDGATGRSRRLACTEAEP